MLAPFLFITTLISGFAFYNEGGAECVANQGAKPCIESLKEASEKILAEDYNSGYNNQ